MGRLTTYSYQTRSAVWHLQKVASNKSPFLTSTGCFASFKKNLFFYVAIQTLSGKYIGYQATIRAKSSDKASVVFASALSCGRIASYKHQRNLSSY
jgi:hypothetical protein